MHRPSDNLGGAYVETAEKLRGRERRIFMAQVVNSMGKGGQRYAEQEFKWNRGTIRRGMGELKGKIVERAIDGRGRKPAEHHLPTLLDDITDILHQQPNTSTAKMRRALIETKQYTENSLPSHETLRRKMRQLESVISNKVK